MSSTRHAPTNGSPPTNTASPKTLRILMLHGYTQSGPHFRNKTRALEKKLVKAFPERSVSLVYPTAPIRLTPADIPGFSPLTSTSSASNSNADSTDTTTGTDADAYAWWRRRNDAEPYYYEGLESGLGSIAKVLEEEGPFDGVIGFSQGGSAAGMVASLLEEGRRKAFVEAEAKGGMRPPDGWWPRRDGRALLSGLVTDETGEEKDNESTSHTLSGNGSTATNAPYSPNNDSYTAIHPPLKFAVSYSGYGTYNPLYAGFFNPRITTPMLHFIGTLDTVVEERRSLMLVEACAGGGGGGGGGEKKIRTRDEVTEEKDNNYTGSGERVVYHPGGHFLPASQKQLVGALVGFIKEAITETEG